MPTGHEHYLEILNAALPHLPANARHSCSILLKADDLIKNMQAPKGEFSASSLETEAEPFDVEKLMDTILPVCNPAEQNLCHQVLNFVRARKLYQSYQDYQRSNTAKNNHSSANDDADSPNGDTNPPNEGNRASHPSFQDFLLSQLNPSQKETLAMFQTILSQ